MSSPARRSPLDRFFRITERGSSPGAEVRGGTTTFIFSITNGIGAAFVMHTFLKAVNGKAREVHWMMNLVSAAFVVYFGLAALHAAFGI